MSTQSLPQRTTRHHRVDEDFLALLEEDFDIPTFSLRRAFLGVPTAPKRQAIELCEWATRQSDGIDERGRMLRAWAKKNHQGQYDPRMQDDEPATFGGVEARGV